MTITNGHVVEIDYTLTDDNGQVLDSSREEGRFPLSYLHGGHNIIPGLEKHLEGKKEGDQFKVTVDPSEGYGERSSERVISVPREELSQIQDLEEGMQLRVQTPQGEQIFRVQTITDESVTLDGNHPLAGMTLNFDVEIVSVRKATQEEIDHGHVHGPGGHEH